MYIVCLCVSAFVSTVKAVALVDHRKEKETSTSAMRSVRILETTMSTFGLPLFGRFVETICGKTL